jgi:diacylglycerol O-acyltransferase
LPAPGGEQELDNLMGRLMSVELDRHRPLWEAWMVEGLTEGRWAVISKVHHCMVDGVSGTDLMVQLLDSTPEPSAPLPDTWEPTPEPSGAALYVDALTELAMRPAEQARAVGAMARRPRRAVNSAKDTVRGLLSLGAGGFHTLCRSRAHRPARRWAAARSSLDEIKQIRGAFGGRSTTSCSR